MGIIRSTLVFGSGTYIGVYLAQNYRIPLVESPQDLFSKIKTAIVRPEGPETTPASGDTTSSAASKELADIERAKAWLGVLNVIFKKDPKE